MAERYCDVRALRQDGSSEDSILVNPGQEACDILGVGPDDDIVVIGYPDERRIELIPTDQVTDR
jgi:hypothetical protein